MEGKLFCDLLVIWASFPGQSGHLWGHLGVILRSCLDLVGLGRIGGAKGLRIKTKRRICVTPAGEFTHSTLEFVEFVSETILTFGVICL